MSFDTSDWKPDEIARVDHSIENGRWVVCNHNIQFGTPVEDPPGTTTFEVDHSAIFYTAPNPFDWYVFGFACNWGLTNLTHTRIAISDTGNRENISTRFNAGPQIFGVPNQQFPGGWLPLQCTWYEESGIHKAWAWTAIDTRESQFGMSIWYDGERSLKFIAPYVVRQGDQLSFQIQNRCTGDFTDATVTVIGQRWLPWDEGGYWQ